MNDSRQKYRVGVPRVLRLAWFAALVLASVTHSIAGTWTALVNKPPVLSTSNHGNPTLMLLLSDGTVFVEKDPTGGGGSNWFRLSPDIHGNYANGTWSLLAPMNYTRAGCASDILTNGNVFVAGGEYGTGGPTAELYDPLSNVWTVIPVPTNLLDPTKQSPIWATGVMQSFGDAISEIPPDGRVLVAPVAVAYSHETMIYDPLSNTFTAGGNVRSSSQVEASWVKLPDQSILTIDPSSLNTKRYLPARNQ